MSDIVTGESAAWTALPKTGLDFIVSAAGVAVDLFGQKKSESKKRFESTYLAGT